jgi:tripartite-type tricarboxylate transporter receptor subunit TctC
MILAAPGFQAGSLKDLIAYSKAHPGAVRVATVGLGSFPHLMFEMLRKQAGFDYTHVPYRGGVQIAPDLMTGRIEVGSLSFANGLSHTERGGPGRANHRRNRTRRRDAGLVWILRSEGHAAHNDQ